MDLIDFKKDGLRFQVEVGEDDDLLSEESELDYEDDVNGENSSNSIDCDASQSSAKSTPPIKKARMESTSKQVAPVTNEEMEDYMVYNDEALKRVIESRKQLLEEDHAKKKQNTAEGDHIQGNEAGPQDKLDA